jgi:ketosteroid isomerase-like protein
MRIRLVICAAVAVIGGCRSPGTPLTLEHRRAIVDSVQTMLTEWRDAFNAKDFTRAATFYSNDPDFRWFENGELKFRSGKEIGDTMNAEAPGFRSLAVSLVEPQITPLAPGVAVITTNFAEKVTDTTGEMTGFAGAISMTVVHGDAGWRFLVGHVSLVLPQADSSAKGRGRKM